MLKITECQRCGAEIPVAEIEPGGKVTCRRCQRPVLIPDRSPTSRTVKILASLIDIIWYASIALFAAVMIILILLGNESSWTDVGTQTGISIPVRVVLEEPQRVGFETVPFYNSYIHLKGFEYPLIDRLMPGNLSVWFTFALLWGSIILWIIYQIRRLVLSIRRGYPFSPGNPKRIRQIAVAVFVYIILVNLSNFWIHHIYSERLIIPGMKIESPLINYHPELIILGLTLLVIAQVFKWGARLQMDFDHTV
jgi:DNA-directed RNA polymerase subunit RPC12/RpoP